jgi:hypothetical protein
LSEKKKGVSNYPQLLFLIGGLMTIEFINKWYTKRNNPCKTCLVQATCNQKFRYDCEALYAYRKASARIESIDTWIVLSTFLTWCIGFCLLVIITFCFGIWKWVELANPIWDKLMSFL